MNLIEETYQRWKQCVTDADLSAELAQLSEHPETLKDAFYQNLSFGTGGLRGILGAGTNRMNIYTVAKASQGLADYVLKNFSLDKHRIAISYDSRIKSDVFSRVSAEVFAANGLKVFIYPQLRPTPCLSFAVRELHCAAGIMITASHNPARYNGYKVYGADGCQITTQAAGDILQEIEKLDIFADVKRVPFETAVTSGQIQYISPELDTAFIQAVKKESLLGSLPVDKNVSIVYSPLNGAGLKPVLRVLSESGFANVTVVKEQEQPDGNFPTCPYPNPEIREAMELGLQYARQQKADLFLATDPDCDRVGIAVKDAKGEYHLLFGNETGMLLLDYVCSRRRALGRMPSHPVFIKTIVTSDLQEKIAASYGVKTINVLTGFKFIGEQIGLLEKQGRIKDFIFGCEESYGYLSGTYVRDKDAVNGALLICEMFAYYKAQGKSLLTRLQELYDQYGYCLNTLNSYQFEGAQGFEQMQRIMDTFRRQTTNIGSFKIEQQWDYNKGIDGLPKSNVIKFKLAGGHGAVLRPSGTEPKLKLYLSVTASTSSQAQAIQTELKKTIEDIKSKIS